MESHLGCRDWEFDSVRAPERLPHTLERDGPLAAALAGVALRRAPLGREIETVSLA